MRKKTKLVYGVGVNDVGSPTLTTVNGVPRRCVFYRRWQAMLGRVYSKQFLERRPTYIGCSVIEEWHRLSNFKKWMIKQDWEGKELDKDIMVSGNKLYSPATCCFVSSSINNLINKKDNRRGNLPVGVSFNEVANTFSAKCSNGAGKAIHVGCFNNQIEAYQAYLNFKSKTVRDMASSEPVRIRLALLRIADEIESGVYYAS